MENYSIQSLVNRLCDKDIKEFSLATELNLENQRVLSMDVARTRADILTQQEKETLEMILTYYCKTEKVSYKQGINEILAPFMLMNREGVPLHVCYTCFNNFIEKFIPTLFVDDV